MLYSDKGILCQWITMGHPLHYMWTFISTFVFGNVCIKFKFYWILIWSHEKVDCYKDQFMIGFLTSHCPAQNQSLTFCQTKLMKTLLLAYNHILTNSKNDYNTMPTLHCIVSVAWCLENTCAHCVKYGPLPSVHIPLWLKPPASCVMMRRAALTDDNGN